MSVAKDPSSLNSGLSGSQAGRHEVASAWVQLDQLCDRFEAAWLAGERPSVEAFLDEVPAAYRREALLELVKLDAHYRQPSADAPTVEEYQQRFPQLESVWLRRLLQPRSSALSASGSSAKSSNGTGSATGIPSIPGYDVLELVGRGGMGVVYKARDVKLHRLVALKMVSAGDLASPEMLERFRAEARAVASLQHPNLVQIHEVGEHQGRPYLAFEFVVGGSLEQRLRGEPQLPAAAARLVKSLAHTIQFAHSRAIIHRDLKPANILLSPADSSHGSHLEKSSRAPFASGKASPKSSRPSTAPSADDSSRSRGEFDSVFGLPKISDFGLAKHLESDAQQTCSGAILGTPSYMAPEQAAGRADLIGPPTDVYALGAILYEMLTGRPPFRAPTVLETLDQVRTLEPVSPRAIQPTVPRDLETICLKCLSKEPARRYESAGELADDLDRYLRDEPVRARPVGSTERAWRWCRRHPLVATLVLLLIVVTGSGFAGVFQQWRKAEVNRIAAEEARADAERNQQRAEISLASAEARFQQGRNSVKEIFDIGNELIKQPRMESAGRKVLEKAAQLQDALLADKSSDPSVRFESALIAKSVGWTQHELGLHAAAEESTRKAIDLFQSLVAERPGELALGREVRATHTQLGFICWSRKELDFASESFQEGMRLAEELANRPDHEPYDIGALSHTLTNWGAFLAARGDLGQAIEITDRSVELARKAVRLKPDMANFHNTLATALYRAGKLEEAQVELEKSLELKLAEPALNQYLLAAIAHRTGKSEEAQALFAQAAQDHQANHADDGDHAYLATEVKALLMP